MKWALEPKMHYHPTPIDREAVLADKDAIEKMLTQTIEKANVRHIEFLLDIPGIIDGYVERWLNGERDNYTLAEYADQVGADLQMEEAAKWFRDTLRARNN